MTADPLADLLAALPPLEVRARLPRLAARPFGFA